MAKDLSECGLLLMSLARLPVPSPPREASTLSIADVWVVPSGFHEARGMQGANGKLPIACASVVGRYLWILEGGRGIILVFSRRALDKFPLKPGCLALRHAHNPSLRERAAS